MSILGNNLLAEYYEQNQNVPPASDYIQTNLVLMLDGIENAGVGVHDNTATIWKDLTGHSDAEVYSRSVWKSKSLSSIVEDSYPVYYTSYVMGRWNMPYHLEMVFKIHRRSSKVHYIKLGRYVTCYLNQGSNQVCLSNGTINVMTNDLCPIGSIVSLSFYWNNPNTYIAYINGSPCSWSSDAPQTYSGENDSQRFMQNKSEVFCIRKYSKMLSEQDIVYNYSIDKKRFNLK